jgi:methylenetetrahydrofolate dehydrogenase (NADP+) / methenyltetrahydrofolate cyclohydrolase
MDIAQLSFPKTRVIDGRSAAKRILDEIKAMVAGDNLVPGLAVILVGEDPASSVYVRNKSLRAKECGFHSRQIDFSGDVNEIDLLNVIESLNADPAIHGILVQLPLPRHLNASRVIETIAPEKDVDGFHYANVGRLAGGVLETALVPCTPLGVVALLKETLGESLAGKHAVVIGRSNIVGKPVAQLLLAEDCTVSIVHSKTVDPAALCRQGDILIAAAGVPKLVKADWVKAGAIVIDVGINRVVGAEGKPVLVGDVDFDDVITQSSAITPVPGGVGPMTIAMLLLNTLTAARRARD